MAEGVATAPALLALAATSDVDMPIAETVTALLSGETALSDVVATMMNRAPTSELHGLIPTVFADG